MTYSLASWRGLNTVMCVAFAYAAMVQINDPDPLLWVSVYGLSALICAVCIFQRVPSRIALVFGCGCVLMVLVMMVSAGGIPESQTMSGFPYWEPLRQEFVRELLGLSMIGIWMISLGLKGDVRVKPLMSSGDSR